MLNRYILFYSSFSSSFFYLPKGYPSQRRSVATASGNPCRLNHRAPSVAPSAEREVAPMLLPDGFDQAGWIGCSPLRKVKEEQATCVVAQAGCGYV